MVLYLDRYQRAKVVYILVRTSCRLLHAAVVVLPSKALRLHRHCIRLAL